MPLELHRPETSLPANQNGSSRQSFQYSKVKNGFVGKDCIIWYLEVFSQHEDDGEAICHKGIEMSREGSGLLVMGAECGEQALEVRHWAGRGESTRVMGTLAMCQSLLQERHSGLATSWQFIKASLFSSSSYTLQEKLF